MRITDDPYLPRVMASMVMILLAVGAFVLLTARNGTPLGIYDLGLGDHWPASDHSLTIVDRTGDATWHRAIVTAIATWQAGGSDLRFTLTSAAGPCVQQRDHIEYCQAGTAELAKEGSDQDQGLFLPKVGRSHDYRSAILLVCSACQIDRTRMLTIATHELGHALGLVHSPDPDSVMYYQGGSTQPDAADYQALRRLEGVASMGE